MWWLGVLFAYVLLVNHWTYALFAEDKFRAVHGYYRVPESRLLLMVALGGAPAALVARSRLRHKTRAERFGTRLLGIVGLQIGLGIGALGVAATTLAGI